MSGRPLDVLEEALDTVVTVELKDGSEHVGILAGYDQHMNIVLEPEPTAESEGTTIIRGDNVVSIQT